MALYFRTDNTELQAKFEAALRGLAENVSKVFGYDRPVLQEGAGYRGIWLECGPHEGAVYGMVDPQVALDNHRVFFRHQREDGYLPCLVRPDDREIHTAQIQMVVPIAATAYEVYQSTGDVTFLEEAYAACARWDSWLRRYRNTRGTGLCELFCGHDTGHDNSPRCAGMPVKCPDNDARLCPKVEGLPYLAPDLSATVCGGRVALARMARRLGRQTEAEQWEARAEHIRRAILAYCFDPEDLCFYDLDCSNRFVRIRGDALTRVLGEHVVDAELFEAVYAAQIRRPEAFWTPYPLPSISADDPAFVREIPHNSWGGASQALTALRAPRWMEYYGKRADLVLMMSQWVRALVAADGFRQQLNPWTGEFTAGQAGYSPAMLVMIDYVARLHGVRRDGEALEWTCLLPEGSSWSEFELLLPQQAAKLSQTRGEARLSLDGRLVAQVRGPCRIRTDSDGRLHCIVGVHAKEMAVTVARPAGREWKAQVRPDEIVSAETAV